MAVAAALDAAGEVTSTLQRIKGLVELVKSSPSLQAILCYVQESLGRRTPEGELEPVAANLWLEFGDPMVCGGTGDYVSFESIDNDSPTAMLRLVQCVDNNWMTVYAMLRRFMVLRDVWEACFARLRQPESNGGTLKEAVQQWELEERDWEDLGQVLACLEPIK